MPQRRRLTLILQAMLIAACVALAGWIAFERGSETRSFGTAATCDPSTANEPCMLSDGASLYLTVGDGRSNRVRLR